VKNLVKIIQQKQNQKNKVQGFISMVNRKHISTSMVRLFVCFSGPQSAAVQPHAAFDRTACGRANVIYIISCGGHRRSQGGQRGHDPPKCLKHIVILCFEMRYPKQNSIIRLKYILAPQIFGLATLLVAALH